MHAMARQNIPQYSEDLFRTLQPLPTINGSIKTLPDEFLVDESLPFEPDGAGEHLYLQIEKTGANTDWVAYQLASFLGVRDLDVSYAGRKDRHAVTTQWFSCYLPRGADVDWAQFSVEGVVVKAMTWHRSKLRTGQLQCNVFRIRVRFRGAVLAKDCSSCPVRGFQTILDRSGLAGMDKISSLRINYCEKASEFAATGEC